MRVLRRIAAVVTCVAFLGGCFQVETTVRINSDGSGTVEERMLMSDKVISQIDEMAKAFAGPEEKQEPFTLHDVKALRKRADEMGAGVEFVSSKAVSGDGYTGYRAIYSFRDINKLRLSQEGPKKPGEDAGDAGKAGGKPFLFQFTPGKEARLVIIPPRNDPAARKEEPKAGSGTAPEGQEAKQALTPEQEREAAEMLKGLRFSLTIEVNGKVVASNATYREGGRITVFEFDLGKMGADPEKLSLLKKMDPSNFAEAKELMKAFPGIKADLNDRMEIVFAR
jgi:hypothetical protein